MVLLNTAAIKRTDREVYSVKNVTRISSCTNSGELPLPVSGLHFDPDTDFDPGFEKSVRCNRTQPFFGESPHLWRGLALRTTPAPNCPT